MRQETLEMSPTHSHTHTQTLYLAFFTNISFCLHDEEAKRDMT